MLKSLELAFRRIFISTLYGSRTTQRITTPDDCLRLAPQCRILLLRQDRIGDVIVSTPILRALRTKYPEARIDIMLGDNNITVQNLARAYGDTVWRFKKSLPKLLGLMRSLRRVRYDVVIDLIDNASVTSSLLVRSSGARFSVGIDKENAAAYSHVVPLLDRTEFHIVHRIAQLLLPFGIDPASTNLDLEYPLSEQDIRTAQAKLPPKQRRFRLGVNLSGRGEEMYWGQENFIRLVRKMQRAFPAFEVLLLGLPDYAEEANTIYETTYMDGAVALAPSVSSLHEFAALLHECDAVLTPDTSVVHLAAAWKRPTVVLFVYNEFGLAHWTPFHTPHRALVVSEEEFLNGDNAVGTIPFDDVWKALQDLLRQEFPHE
jgi:ADP-heptose:LPS heptosyltransferase